MHEGAIMQTVVTTILEEVAKVNGSRVTRVQLELGASGHMTEEAMRQYFQTLTRNTPSAGAELELVWLPATYQCLSCFQCFESTSSAGTCPHCGEVGLEIAHRESCTLRQIDILMPEV